jgi:hypothetical protein
MMGKSKKKSADDNNNGDAPAKKRGQPTDFKGLRLQFLTENIPAYITASKKKGTKENKEEGLPSFWPNLFAEYWKHFPWDLPFEVDPDPDASPPPPETAEEACEPLKLLPEEIERKREEEERKSKIQTDMKGIR